MKKFTSVQTIQSRAGFSLVEMLVVIAVIGLIAAIAIPNVGNINAAARLTAATRNAQTIATTVNAAIAAGWDASSVTSLDDVLTQIQDGSVTPATGVFRGRVFTTGTLEAESLQLIADKGLLSWDNDNDQMSYVAPAN